MPLTRKLLVAILLTLQMPLLMPATCLAEGKPFRVGYFDLPPHTGLGANATNPGIAISYFEQIAARMAVGEVSYSKMPLPRLLRMLERGELDMILLLAKDVERDARFLYPHQALFSTTAVLAVQASNPQVAIHSVEDLLPLRIGVWQNGYHSPLLHDSRLELHTLSGDGVMGKGLNMVIAGRIDAFYFPDDYALQYEAKTLGNQARIKGLAMPEQHLELYSVFSRKNGNQYLPRYERALSEVQAQQPYTEFFDAFNED